MHSRLRRARQSSHDGDDARHRSRAPSDENLHEREERDERDEREDVRAVSSRVFTAARAFPQVWRVPDGSNPLEALFASDSPIDGLGALTGYWYADVFAAMNVALLLALALYASDGE